LWSEIRKLHKSVAIGNCSSDDDKPKLALTPQQPQNNKNMTTMQAVKPHNIVLDFTSVDTTGEEIALMPAWLAKSLLENLAFQSSSSRAIIGSHIDELRECMSAEGGLQKAIESSIRFVQMRQLITNVQMQNWAAYTLPPL
jgi:hypothetical protein